MIYCDIEVSNSCNLECSYCFLEKANQKSLNIQDLNKRIALIRNRLRYLKQNEATIEFSGGEPLLEIESIKYIVEKFDKSNINVKYSMVTNGTLLSKEVFRYLMEKKFLLGISIDGGEETQNKNRTFRNTSEGSFQLIKHNIDNIIDSYPEDFQNQCIAHMVISKNNYKEFFKSFVQIINIGFKKISSSLDVTYNWDDKQLDILEVELRKCAQYYFNLCNKDKSYYWDFLEKGIKAIINPKQHYFCGGGIIQFTIKADGRILSCGMCQSLEKAVIGDVDAGIIEYKVKPYGNYKRKFNSTCVKCDLKEYCHVPDCVFLNEEITGEECGVPNFFCEMYKINNRISNKIIDKWRKLNEVN